MVMLPEVLFSTTPWPLSTMRSEISVISIAPPSRHRAARVGIQRNSTGIRSADAPLHHLVCVRSKADALIYAECLHRIRADTQGGLNGALNRDVTINQTIKRYAGGIAFPYALFPYGFRPAIAINNDLIG